MSLILVTRPVSFAASLEGDLQARGHETVLSPLMHYREQNTPLPDLSRYDGLVFTSAAAIDILAHRNPVSPAMPVYAVGTATASAARQAGFTQITTADGDGLSLARLLAQIKGAGRLLHLSGLHIAVDLAKALADTPIAIDRHVLYEAVAAESFTPEALDALRNRKITHTVFFSPRTAAIFGTLVRENRLGDALAGMAALCLSANVADALSALPFGKTLIAARPEQDALLALIDR